jgi:TipAS antibiotic-recognition domain
MTSATWSELQRAWTALAEDIHAAADTNPAAPGSQALLSRWENLIRQTTADDQELVHGLKSLYSNRDQWPERVRQAVLPLLDDRILEFLRRAVAARRRFALGENAHVRYRTAKSRYREQQGDPDQQRHRRSSLVAHRLPIQLRVFTFGGGVRITGPV